MSQHTVIDFIMPTKSRQWTIMMAPHPLNPTDAKNMYGYFFFLVLFISVVFNATDVATVRTRRHRNMDPSADTGCRELNIKGKTSLPGAEPGEGQNQSISPQNETKSIIHKTRQSPKVQESRPEKIEGLEPGLMQIHSALTQWPSRRGTHGPKYTRKVNKIQVRLIRTNQSKTQCLYWDSQGKGDKIQQGIETRKSTSRAETETERRM